MGGGSVPLSKRTSKSVKTINGRRVTTTRYEYIFRYFLVLLVIFRIEENGQTIEIIEEDGQIKSKRVNGVLQSIK